MPNTRVVGALLVAALAADRAAAQVPAGAAGEAVPAEQLQAAWQLLRQLDMPAAADLPLVRLTRGNAGPAADGRFDLNGLRGLLVADDGQSFVVLTHGFRLCEYRRHPGAAGGRARGHAYAPVDLAEVADWYLGLPPLPFSLRRQLLFYAWVCAEQGEVERSHALASRLVPGRPRRFLAAVRAVLADWEYEEIVASLADAQRDQAAAGARLARWLELFEDHALASHVRELAADVATALGHELSADADYATRLVDQLADAAGRHHEIGGPPFVDKGPGSRAARVLELGLAAVPALLAALDDSRPTRVYGRREMMTEQSRLLRVGDVALQLLEELSGRACVPRDRGWARLVYERWWWQTQSPLEPPPGGGDRRR